MYFMYVLHMLNMLCIMIYDALEMYLIGKLPFLNWILPLIEPQGPPFLVLLFSICIKKKIIFLVESENKEYTSVKKEDLL